MSARSEADPVPRRRVAPRRAATVVTVLVSLSACAAADDTRLERSRTVADAFQARLGATLQAALAAGGPVAAISVCSDEAPRIAASFGHGPGPRVGRTALRVRNPTNAPDAVARVVLADFESRLAAGALPPVEHFTAAADGSARYLRAIVMQPMCLPCHGEALAPEVAAAIAARYPDDRATGFASGALRGAFVVEWPAGTD